MEHMRIELAMVDGAWADVLDNLAFEEMCRIERIGVLENATSSGKEAVEILVRLPDGKFIIVETTRNLFQTAAMAMKGRYGDPR